MLFVPRLHLIKRWLSCTLPCPGECCSLFMLVLAHVLFGSSRREGRHAMSSKVRPRRPCALRWAGWRPR